MDQALCDRGFEAEISNHPDFMTRMVHDSTKKAKQTILQLQMQKVLPECLGRLGQVTVWLPDRNCFCGQRVT